MKAGTMKVTMAAVGVAALFATAESVWAGSKWRQVAELRAVGDAKEVAVNRVCSKARVVVKEGNVAIQTFVVREGAKKTPITIARGLRKGQKFDIDLGGRKQVTGFRIRDSGGGRYRLHVQ